MTAGGGTVVGGDGGEPPVLGPMLAGAVGMPADPTGWVFEPKWDGIRAIARSWPGGLTLTSRLGNDVTASYPELVPLAAALAPRAAVLDGEIVAFDGGGRPSFESIQRRMHVRGPSAALLAEVPVLYVVFDLLWLDGEALTAEAFTDRRRHLDALDLQGPNWRTSQILPEPPGPDLMAASRRLGLEGYVGKLGSSPYVARRSRSWTKIKSTRRREFVVGGWSEGSGGRAGQVGSLAVGWVDPDAPVPPGHPFALRYAGQVGSGLTAELIGRLGAAFEATVAGHSPFVPPPVPPPGIHPVRPEVVVEVVFSEMTTAGVLRQASLKGLRDDVAPESVVWTEELVR